METSSALPMTSENFEKGFLIDHEWMAGVTSTPKGFLAYVVDLESGENIGSHLFPSVEGALQAFANMKRQWIYESTSACGNGACKSGAGNDGEVCHQTGGTCTQCGACK